MAKSGKWLRALALTLAVLPLVLFLGGCPGKHVSAPPPDERSPSIQVFYGTDRQRTGSEEPNEFYGGNHGQFTYGVCSVSIPPDHRIGDLERPTWWKFEFREDPNKHVVLTTITAMSADPFFSALQETVRQSSAGEAFVFIHGFNVSFAEAARRTGQLAYDLQFDGAPVLYSWPSRGNVAEYTVDEATVERTVPNLEAFLIDVAQKSGAETVHLIAHSMGNRALTAALDGIATDGPDLSDRFREIVLTAPDIDAETFKNDIAPTIVSSAKRVTLYASSNDKALKASKAVHGGRRAGDTEGGIVIVDGMTSIDASAVDTGFLGHTYYGDNTHVLSDLYTLLKTGDSADMRFGLRREETAEGVYWVFAPGL